MSTVYDQRIVLKGLAAGRVGSLKTRPRSVYDLDAVAVAGDCRNICEIDNAGGIATVTADVSLYKVSISILLTLDDVGKRG